MPHATENPTTAVHPQIVDDSQAAEVYRLAFSQVSNPADWRAPFSCWVPWAMANVYMDAIEFMVGAKPTCEGRVVLSSGRQVCKLNSVGYRNGPCGS